MGRSARALPAPSAPESLTTLFNFFSTFICFSLLLLLCGCNAGEGLTSPTATLSSTATKAALAPAKPTNTLVPIAKVALAPLPSATLIPPTATDTPLPTVTPTFTPQPTDTPFPTFTPWLTSTPLPTFTPLPSPTSAFPTPALIGNREYTVYLPAKTKKGQAYKYSCEFDAGWLILQSYGFEVSTEELIAKMPKDQSVEPTYRETQRGFEIHGGNIQQAYSGDYTWNFLARSTGEAFAQVFAAYGLKTAPVQSRDELEAALLRGELVWIKTTVDFKSWRPATWFTPQGEKIKTVLGNDHAVVVRGFNAKVVAIDDPLGPTSTGWQRPLEYDVAWETFLAAWEAQAFDGLAVARPE